MVRIFIFMSIMISTSTHLMGKNGTHSLEFEIWLGNTKRIKLIKFVFKETLETFTSKLQHFAYKRVPSDVFSLSMSLEAVAR